MNLSVCHAVWKLKVTRWTSPCSTAGFVRPAFTLQGHGKINVIFHNRSTNYFLFLLTGKLQLLLSLSRPPRIMEPLKVQTLLARHRGCSHNGNVTLNYKLHKPSAFAVILLPSYSVTALTEKRLTKHVANFKTSKALTHKKVVSLQLDLQAVG